MEEKDFRDRLAKLRIEQGISARDMSISLGQNPGYINNIENGKALPSVSAFFSICRFLKIAPKDFFDDGNVNPREMQKILEDLKKLDENQLYHIGAIIAALGHEEDGFGDK